MFKKSDKTEGDTPEEPTQNRVAPGYTSNIEVRTRSVSVIGPTLSFKGELSANEDLVIEGQVEGKIAHQEKNLTVGKQGRVSADIRAQNVEIQGHLNGDIVCDQLVKLARSAVVNGNIECARIVMEDGARFDGNIKMEPQKKPSQKAKLKVADGAAAKSNVEQGAA